MRAAVLREYNAPLSIETVADPACPDDGVVLKVEACGVCRSDWHGWVGEHPKVKPGQIGGHEYCGEVIEAGPRAKHKVGDMVVAPFILACGSCPSCQSGAQNTCPNQRLPGFVEPGAFAEYVAVPFDHNLSLLPEGLSATVAAGLGCRVTTAWHGLTGRAGLQTGEWLAVHGTGGVGLSALILGQALGARVFALMSSLKSLSTPNPSGRSMSLTPATATLARGSKSLRAAVRRSRWRLLASRRPSTARSNVWPPWGGTSNWACPPAIPLRWRSTWPLSIKAT